MRQYSAITAIPRTFSSKALYRDVASAWDGMGMLYLLLILLIYLVPLSLREVQAIDHVLEGDAEYSIYRGFLARSITPSSAVAGLVLQLPDIAITGGKARVDAPQPYHIRNPKTDAPLITIDTTGTTTALTNPDTAALVTADQILVWENGRAVTRWRFAETQDMALTGEDFQRWSRLLPLIYLPTNLLALFIYTGLITFTLATIGLVINTILGAELEYKALLRCTAVALTPALALDMLAVLGNVPFFSNPALVVFLLHAVYLYIAIEANVPGKRE